MRRALPGLLLLAACGGPTAPAPAPDLRALALEGVARLERYQEGDTLAAVEIFDRVLARAPAWQDVRVNLALALFASKRGDLLDRAVVEFDRVLASDPTSPHALLGAALVRRFLGDLEGGLPFLHRLLEVDPDEASVWYWLGAFELERAHEDHAAAIGYLRRALALAPDDTTAMAALAMALRRSGEGASDEVAALSARAKALAEGEGFGTPALTKHRRRGDKEYGEGGRYTLAIRDLAPPSDAGFRVPADVGGPQAGGGPVALACGDLDDDGADDLVVGSPTTPVRWLSWRAGRLVDRTEGSGLEGAGPATAALLCDLDDDGRLDLVLASERGVRGFVRDERGRFAPLPAEAFPVRRGPAPTALCAADVDHDGDLDLLLAGPRTTYLRNRRDGTFEDATEAAGLALGETTACFAADLDHDDVTDVVAVGGGRLHLLRNGRLDPFVADPRAAALGPVVAATADDLDADGALDLVLLREDGAVSLARGDGRGGFGQVADLPRRDRSARTVAVADLDGDGRLDLLVLGKTTRRWRGLGGFVFREEPLSAPALDVFALGVLDLDGDGDLDLVLGSDGAGPRVLENLAGASTRSLRLRLRGVPDRVEGRTWSNARGVGAAVDVFAGDVVARRTVRAGSGFPGQVSDVLVVGVGGRTRAEAVRVRWTDGVLQSEHEVPVGRRHEIVEVNRKLASCPVVFVWDGEAFAYVADTLGAGGLGFYVGGPQRYGPPDPTEVLALPPLAPHEGRFLVRLVENLEEVAYLDEARLLVVDHADDVEILADERFATAPPLPTGRLLTVRRRLAPRAASDDRGRDVLDRVRADDRVTVDGFTKDRRFLGLCAPHALELDFGDDLPEGLADGGGALFLCLSGWIEYGYSRTVYGAEQAGVAMQPPVLEVPDGEGWRVVAELGYPAGTPRTMTFDVTAHLGPGRGRCRVRTNLEVYWDRASLAVVDAASPPTTTLEAMAATLSLKGYPREFSPDGRLPTRYDYSVCEAWVPYRTIPGDYTRLGDVRPLVVAADDRAVVFGKGEEVALDFDATALPPLAPGRRRSFFLHLCGWCKDRDPYTGAGTAVEPLPFHGMSTYPFPPGERPADPAGHVEYRARWNTRRIR